MKIEEIPPAYTNAKICKSYRINRKNVRSKFAVLRRVFCSIKSYSEFLSLSLSSSSFFRKIIPISATLYLHISLWMDNIIIKIKILFAYYCCCAILDRSIPRAGLCCRPCTDEMKFVDVTVTYFSTTQEPAAECNRRKEDLDIAGETRKRKKQMAEERWEGVVCEKGEEENETRVSVEGTRSTGSGVVDTRCTLTEGIDPV